MNAKNTISTTEARQRFAEVIDDVEKRGARYTFTVNGRPKAVMIGAEEFESMEETLEILSDPVIMAQIRQSEQELAAGLTVNLDDLLADETAF